MIRDSSGRRLRLYTRTVKDYKHFSTFSIINELARFQEYMFQYIYLVLRVSSKAESTKQLTILFKVCSSG